MTAPSSTKQPGQRERLTAKQRVVLADIITPDPELFSGFPPRNTVQALIRKGFVEAVERGRG